MPQVDVEVAARKALPTDDSEGLSEQQPGVSSVPQAFSPDSRLVQEMSPFKTLHYVKEINEKSSAASTAQGALQKEPDSLAAIASKAAAAALPDSDGEDNSQSNSATEQTKGDTRSKSAGDLAHAGKRSTMDSPESAAQVADKAAATALPDSDEEADEDLESQASVSVPGLPSSSHDRLPRSHSDQVGSSAVVSHAAAGSAAPRRPLGRLDSLSASDTESAEVQSQQDSAPQSILQAQPAASPWTESSFGSGMLASGISAASAPGGRPTAFGVSFGDPIRPVLDSSTSAQKGSPMPLGKGTSASSMGAPSLGQRSGVSKAPSAQSPAAPALPTARQGSGSLPALDAAGSFGQPEPLPQRQSSTALPPFRPLVGVRL